MLQQRSSGLLLHITSLPSAHGVGDIGPEAYRFADFLASAGQTYWQILPLTPVDPGAGFSPYSSPSAFAGNILMISLEKLAEDNWLTEQDLDVFNDQPIQDLTITNVSTTSASTVQAGPLVMNQSVLHAAWIKKKPLLHQAAETFLRNATPAQRSDYDRFCTQHSGWLTDYALFSALQEETGEPFWLRWPEDLVRRNPTALAYQTERLQDRIGVISVLQYFFFKQWNELLAYCYDRRIHLVGDIPIYVQLNSADVWANPGLFKLDTNFEPLFVAGAPPDYFSEYGQRWGNPIYDWAEHERTGFSWWMQRMRHQMSLYSLTRLDHFLGFAEYWEIPASEPTAQVGTWVKAPIEAFMQAMYRQFVQLPIIAEDLGAKAADIQPYLRHYGIPGMRVIQFGFGEDLPTSSYAVHNHTENFVVYSGTHDNNTTLGWFRESDAVHRQRMDDYFGFPITEENVVDQICRLTMQSVARLAIMPVQDVLNLNESHRMNTPGLGGRSWQWRLELGQLTAEAAAKLLKLTKMTGRV
ncbi:4-alpha-glucanotransferase [Spirosoma utsteinense]|uniref:4-alpha-glucanotransferase n=1 Tax=Spirosoma utsteinense TaxID=2585773 RepID=A0ABR6W3L7_9BACT|nr:4-alpha-glucanotransferase [Spirosoma utsteinense]MBC3784832.1 4-alpha-glucanotransferase [Spirosoma utsteinense]MBC3791130.1 4-alpha-glucanotransferase [Spirosoma utsteinense]